MLTTYSRGVYSRRGQLKEDPQPGLETAEEGRYRIMSAMLLQVQIKSMEARLSVLKAQLRSGAEAAKPRGSFGSFYGILSGKSDSTEEEIRAARYRSNWDGDSEQ